MKPQGRNRFCRVALSPLTADRRVRLSEIDRSPSLPFDRDMDRPIRLRTDLFQSFGIGAHLTFGIDDREEC